MICWGQDESAGEPDGECPDCEEPTVGGEAVNVCTYSPVECKKCGWAPCDGSC